MGADNHMTTVPKELQTEDDGRMLELNYESGSISLEREPRMGTFVRVYEDGEYVGLLSGTAIRNLAED
jgi:hypothetical protein